MTLHAVLILFYRIDSFLFVNTGQLYNPQPQFATRGVSTGHNVIQHGYAGQLHAPMPPQQGVVIQPHNRGIAPLLPFGGTD